MWEEAHTHLFITEKKWTLRKRNKQNNGWTDRQAKRKSYEQIDR